MVKGILVSGLNGFGKFCPSSPDARSPVEGGEPDCASAVTGMNAARVSTTSAAQHCFMVAFSDLTK
jgi:hypothetical protein